MKKIYFIHVAKTAGSSFNRLLHHNLSGEEHCEKYLEPDQKTLKDAGRLKRLEFISGHLKFKVFDANQFARSDYFLVTILRHPVYQTFSHMNWIIRISEDTDSEFFKSHPPGIRRLSLRMRKWDLTQYDVLARCLARNAVAFKNIQSRYFDDVPLDVGQVIRRLRGLDLIGFTEEYDEFAGECCRRTGLTRPSGSDVVNKNDRYALPRTLLEDDRIFALLRDYNGVDMQVYEYFWRQRGRAAA